MIKQNSIAVEAAELQITKTIYFPGLNALRYIAAALVVLCHVEEFKKNKQLPNYYNNSFVHDSGTVAVTFFFVLSGFLITYLLLLERNKTYTVSVRSFYIRRALRIWPVYYLITALGLFILPYFHAFDLPVFSAQALIDQPTNAFLYIMFLPNIALWLGHVVPYASQLWSVGTEEQFYLFWPWLFKRSGSPLPVMLLIIVAITVIRVGTEYLSYHWLDEASRHIASNIYSLTVFIRLDCMAFGGVGAYLIYTKQVWFQKYFIHPLVEIGSLLGVVAVMALPLPLRQLHNDVYSILFLLLIINISCSNYSILRLEGKFWTFLGNISYSVYMYQYLAIGLIFFIIERLRIVVITSAANTAVHIMSQLLTIVFAYLSYRFFETPFLKLKKNFMIVKSTDGHNV